jgi:hypothetical protein
MDKNKNNAVNSEIRIEGQFWMYGNGCKIQGNEINGVRTISSVTVKYETEPDTHFEIYGDGLTRKLEVSGILSYTHY